jgi:hypothetical protein
MMARRDEDNAGKEVYTCTPQSKGLADERINRR